MKLIYLGLILLIMAGCGDTVNNYPAGTTATGTATTGLPTFNNATSHPPVIAGSAAYIPSNTFCTQKMNEVFTVEGQPLTIDVQDGLGNHYYQWHYQTTALTTTYYFWYNDIGFFNQLEPCHFDFFKLHTITP